MADVSLNDLMNLLEALPHEDMIVQAVAAAVGEPLRVVGASYLASPDQIPRIAAAFAAYRNRPRVPGGRPQRIGRVSRSAKLRKNREYVRRRQRSEAPAIPEPELKEVAGDAISTT